VSGIGADLPIDFLAEFFQEGFELGDIFLGDFFGSDALILAAEQAEDGGRGFC
jgi:hypothetical protein